MQQRQTAPALSDAEAEKIASQQMPLTEEQLLVTAMLGKFVQNDINTIKKASLGDLKVSDVDMSKVMPSGIAKAMGMKQVPLNKPVPVLPPSPVVAEPVNTPVQPVPVIMTPAVMNPVLEETQKHTDDNQLELPLDKKATYDDVMREIIQINERLDTISDRIYKILTIIESGPKKKLKKEQDGTQTG